MQSSVELRDFMLRFFQATADGDTAFIERAYSRDPATLQIGTDPSEWWRGWDTIAGIWGGQIAALGGSMPVVAYGVEASQEGNTGWAAANGAIRVAGQPEVPLRLTGVFHREDGAWNMVQGHGSIGVPNVEAAFGEVPT